jgi:hypothetical protein
MLNSENILLVIYKKIKMHYVMQDSNFVGLPKESKLFNNIQLLN